MLEAVGDQVVDHGAHGAQRLHADRACRGAVGVVVGDDEQALPRPDSVGEEARGVLDVVQPLRRGERLQCRGELVHGGQAARRENAREARVAARGGELLEGRGVDDARDDLRHGRRAASSRERSASERRR